MPFALLIACASTTLAPPHAAFAQESPRKAVRDQATTSVVRTSPDAGEAKRSKTAAIDAYLSHAYTVYFGLRACSEMSAERHDGSFMPSVSIEAARQSLRSIDAAAAEVAIDSNAVWAAAAPRATVTAEALKADPPAHLDHCQKMGSLFRIDVGNLQPLFQSLGAKTVILTKDY